MCAFTQIRPARPDDAARIAVLCDQLGYPTSAEAVRGRIAEIGTYPKNVTDASLCVGISGMGMPLVFRIGSKPGRKVTVTYKVTVTFLDLGLRR